MVPLPSCRLSNSHHTGQETLYQSLAFPHRVIYAAVKSFNQLCLQSHSGSQKVVAPKSRLSNLFAVAPCALSFANSCVWWSAFLVAKEHDWRKHCWFWSYQSKHHLSVNWRFSYGSSRQILLPSRERRYCDIEMPAAGLSQSKDCIGLPIY